MRGPQRRSGARGPPQCPRRSGFPPAIGQTGAGLAGAGRFAQLEAWRRRARYCSTLTSTRPGRVPRPGRQAETTILSVGQCRVICKAFAHNAKGSMSKRGVRKMPGSDKDGDKPDGSAPAPPTADPAFAMHEHIGRQLKTMFDEVVTQPVPDKLLKLLE